MKNKFKIKYTALLTILIACFSFHANAQSCPDGSYEFADMVFIFQANNCTGCHGGSGGLNLSDYNNVIIGGNRGMGGCGPYATALDFLVGKVDGSLMPADGCGNAMPNGTTAGTPGMPAADIAAIQTWIDAGAPQFCPPSACTDIIATAQPVCNGTVGTFDIQINSIAGGDGLGDPTGTYTISDGTNTITYPTQTTIAGLTYTGQNDKITLTITDDDDSACTVTYDVLQLECLDQTVCNCGVDDPFNINAQASANGDGYSMVYAVTDNGGFILAVNQTGSFGPFPDDGMFYNVFAYNVADADLAGLEADLNTLIGSIVDPSLTASQAAPFDAYCYTDVTASFTEDCDVLGEIILEDQTICSADATGYDLTTLEPADALGGIWTDENGNTVSTVDVTDGDFFVYTYTDANGCMSDDSLTFTVNEGTTVVADVFLCPEDAVTDYDLTPNEPAGTTGTWDVADPTSVDVTAGGTFTYTYTDENGCTSAIEVAIGILDDVVFTVNDISLCEGETGVLEPVGLDNLGTYTYAWSEGTTTPTLLVNFEGDYTLSVTDAFGCIGTATATVTFLPACDATCSTIQTCDDGDPLTINDMEVVAADGSVCTACAGVPADACSDTTVEACDDGNPCTVNDQQEVSNLDGSICVPCVGTVDAGSCDATCTTTQACDDGDPCTQNDMETISANGGICIPCAGTSVGTVTIIDSATACGEEALSFDLTAFEPTGSTGTWTGVADATSADVSAGGSFIYNFTNESGCDGVLDLSITVLDDIQITAVPTCNSAAEGTFFIDIQDITGGSQASDYTVEANGLSVNYTGAAVAIGPFIYTDHNAGITLNVTSIDGCTTTYDVLQLNCADQEVCDCDGSPDTPYTITAQAAANGNGYSMVYALVNNDNSNMVEATNDTGIFPDLADNTNYTVYAFNVEDIDVAGFTADLGSLMMISAGDEVLNNMGAFANYCYEAASAAFAEDCACITCDDFVINANVTDLTCNGDASGAIDLTVLNGQTPYTYTWSNGATTEDLAGLDGGAYTVTVNDAGECSDIITVTVSEPAAIGISNIDITNPTCSASDGTIVVSVENGIGPFTYDIDGLGISQSSNTITGVPAGDYTVTVTDANGCTAFIPVTLTGTDAPTATIAVTQAPDCEESNGTLTVTATGGTPPYAYIWDDAAAQTTATATSLSGGTYTVIVTDAGGCSVTESITLFPVGCDFSITNSFFADDPCTCNNDQTDNGSGDGTFTETVTVLAPPGLIIRADVTSTGIEDPVNQGLSSSTLPIEFYESFPGRYILIFNHIDRIGYTINVEYSEDGGNTFIPVPDGAGGQLSYTNVCAYPVLAFNPPLEEAYCEDDGIVVIGVIETSDNVDFVPLAGFPAVALNNEDAQPAPLTFDPSTVGTATYTFSGFYNYENGTGTGGTLENPAVSLNPCATLIRVNVPVNPVPISEATCEQTGSEEFIIDVDPMEDYEEPENLMYRIGNSGPFQMSDQFVVEEDGDYEMQVIDMVSACLFQVPAVCFRQLPIELTSFEGACISDEYVLTWTTATEEDVSHFVVERSVDGQNYAAIGEVPAEGNSTVTQTYGYKDDLGLSRQYYYRLRIIEFSGTETLSRIEIISCLTGGFGVLDVYPNPTQDEVAVTFEVNSRDRLNIRLVDVLGRTVNAQEFTPDIGLNRVVIDMSILPSAMYYIVLEDGTQQSVEKVVKK